MWEKIKLPDGTFAEIKNVMIDVDGTNLEEGIDIYFEKEYKGSLIGMSTDSYDAEMIQIQIQDYV
jgi:hypothetical protein